VIKIITKQREVGVLFSPYNTFYEQVLMCSARNE